MRLYYRLTTKEPLVLSQSAATTSNHLGLDYIPGSAVLGAIASRLYCELPKEQSFALFHSGACRFGPAYPLIKNEIALPIPAAWHGLKQDSQALSNHSAPDFLRNDSLQYKQRRQGYINHLLEKASVAQGLTTRTALDENLRVKEGQLYTYTTLQAGQDFGGWVDTDSAELLDLIKPFLNTELNIGRSRSSEFGRVQLSCDLGQQTSEPEISDIGSKTLVLWCLSDAQCFNQLGSPTFTPDLSLLHPELTGQLNVAKSFIRTRKIRRFNRARNGLDTEQLLIAAGSVLVYDLTQSASQTALKALSQQGIGINRQQGLGWVYVNPAWAAHSQPKGYLFSPLVIGSTRSVVQSGSSSVTSPLVEWVKQLADEDNTAQKTEQQISELHQCIYEAYNSARIYNNLSNHYQAGPSSSQWRRLDRLVKEQVNWQIDAFQGEAAVCKPENDELGWGLSWQKNNNLIRFSDFAKEHFNALDNKTMRKLLEQLCRFNLSDSAELKKYKVFIDATKKGERA